jgi:diguanylate cyclase (GGDEF)-like protein/putative nucleotidyltransferase with HDIG domain
MYTHTKGDSLRLASIPPSFWYSLVFASAFLIIVGSWFVLAQIDPQLALKPGNGEVSVAALVCLVISWIGVKRSPRGHRATSAHQPLERRLHFLVPFVFSIVLLLQASGSCIFAYYDWRGIETLPPLGLGLLLGRYPAMLVGFFLLSQNTSSGKLPLRFVMDSLVLIVTLITFSWYFTLGPMLLPSSGVSLSANIAFPVGDLLIISCLVLLSHSTADRGLRKVISVLSFGLIIFVLTDSILAYQDLYGPASDWLSLGWIGGDFTIALSLHAMRWLPDMNALQKGSTPGISSLIVVPMWRSLLSYLLIPAVMVLVFSLVWTAKSSPLAIGTYICSLLLLILISMKQLVVIQEIYSLNRGFQGLQRVIVEKNAALQQANAHLETLATTDPLTELPNHRALFETLEKEVERARRYGHPLSILFFDGDHFKRVNDTHGHSVGDAVLRELGSRAKGILRGGDTLGRYGGEEFMVLLPETDLVLAREVAERLRVEVATHPLAAGLVEGGLHITISIGVATFPVDGQSASEVVEQADQAMYWAKRLGRNQLRTVLEAQEAAADSALAATLSTLERRDEEEGQPIEQAVRDHQLSTIHSLMWLLERRDHGISTHSYQVSDLAGAIAQELGLEQAEVFAVSTAGLLHDIGKIAIPDHLLQKEGALSASERALIQQHPELGAQILEVSPYLHTLMPAVHHHHENWDGTGYPQELRGEEIPLAARIIRVSEAYQAMMSTRPYQAGRSAPAARRELQRCSGTHFDPAVVEAAMRVLLRQEEEAVEGRDVGLVS